MNYKIIIWGTGERARKLVERKYFETCDIQGFVDTYKKEKSFLGYNVFDILDLPDSLKSIDYLVIANQYFIEILALCAELKIDRDRIVITDNVQDSVFQEMFLRLKDISEELYFLLEDRQLRFVKTNESDQKDLGRITGKGKYQTPIYTKDYFRYRTFEFVAKEILQDKVEGAVAELGVFRGTFASLINEIFKEKRMYLFDTFEGFVTEEAEDEVKMGRCDSNFVLAHKDTSVEQLLKNLPYPEKCIVCKGMFPASVTEEAANEKYCFVSLDVDFEESTYQGLKFFYPRLAEGGALFLHDYNTFYLEGVKCAVKRFEKNLGLKLKKVPLADRAGTFVIVK